MCGIWRKPLRFRRDIYKIRHKENDEQLLDDNRVEYAVQSRANDKAREYRLRQLRGNLPPSSPLSFLPRVCFGNIPLDLGCEDQISDHVCCERVVLMGPSSMRIQACSSDWPRDVRVLPLAKHARELLPAFLQAELRSKRKALITKTLYVSSGAPFRGNKSRPGNIP